MYEVDQIVEYCNGGHGVVKWADDKKFLVKYENGDYELYDQDEEDLVSHAS